MQFRSYALGAGTLTLVATMIAWTSPAEAAGTTTTFTVTAGALSISAPASVALGSVAAGSSLSQSMGAVTVTDARGALDASWTASVVSSDFTTGGGTPAETVPAGDVSYWSGLATTTSGLGAPVPGQATALLAVPIASATTAFAHPVAVGNNSSTWSPTLVIAVPAAAVAGTYTGTVTHSVS